MIDKLIEIEERVEELLRDRSALAMFALEMHRTTTAALVATTVVLGTETADRIRATMQHPEIQTLAAASTLQAVDLMLDSLGGSAETAAAMRRLRELASAAFPEVEQPDPEAAH